MDKIVLFCKFQHNNILIMKNNLRNFWMYMKMSFTNSALQNEIITVI